jgi:hypothetical protein
MYVPMTKPMMLKKGTHVVSGRNCWANASEMGDTTQLTFMTGQKPALTVARTWWNVRAPAIRAMDVRYTLFWMGEICKVNVSEALVHGHGSGATGAYDKVAEEDLEDLGLQALASLEHALQDTDEEVAEGRGNDCAVEGHLGNARGEVGARLAPVVGNPRGEELLQTRQSARGEHLGAQRVALQLLEVGLEHVSRSIRPAPMAQN